MQESTYLLGLGRRPIGEPIKPPSETGGSIKLKGTCTKARILQAFGRLSDVKLRQNGLTHAQNGKSTQQAPMLPQEKKAGSIVFVNICSQKPGFGRRRPAWLMLENI